MFNFYLQILSGKINKLNIFFFRNDINLNKINVIFSILLSINI